MLTLFYTPGACSMVSHIVLEETGASYTRQAIDFAKGEQRSAAFLGINPKARVPALLTDRGVLSENPAIIAYLAQTYPEARLAPVDDAFAFAQVQAFNMYIATGIHVAFRQISRPDAFADGADAATALRAKVPVLSNDLFALIEDQLADGRPFVHGEHYTISDPYLFVFANYLRMGDRGDPARIPNVIAHRDRMRQRPAVARVLEIEGLAKAWT